MYRYGFPTANTKATASACSSSGRTIGCCTGRLAQLLGGRGASRLRRRTGEPNLACGRPLRALRPTEYKVLMGIDDPLDQTYRQNLPEPEGVLDLVVSAAGACFPPAGIVAALKEYASRRGLQERLTNLFSVLKETIDSQSCRVDQAEARLSQVEAVQAVLTAAYETARTVDPKIVERFAKILGNQAAMSVTSWQEVEAVIRDLARLTGDDLKALEALWHTQRRAASNDQMPTADNLYTERFADLVEAAARLGLVREEFYSLCHRLTGFGLAAPVDRNEVRIGPGDQCFRLTSRGLRLWVLLTGNR